MPKGHHVAHDFRTRTGSHSMTGHGNGYLDVPPAGAKDTEIYVEGLSEVLDILGTSDNLTNARRKKLDYIRKAVGLCRGMPYELLFVFVAKQVLSDSTLNKIEEEVQRVLATARLQSKIEKAAVQEKHQLLVAAQQQAKQAKREKILARAEAAKNFDALLADAEFVAAVAKEKQHLTNKQIAEKHSLTLGQIEKIRKKAREMGALPQFCPPSSGAPAAIWE